MEALTRYRCKATEAIRVATPSISYIESMRSQIICRSPFVHMRCVLAAISITLPAMQNCHLFPENSTCASPVKRARAEVTRAAIHFPRMIALVRSFGIGSLV